MASYSEMTNPLFRAVIMLRVKVELIDWLRATVTKTAPSEWSRNIATQLRMGLLLENDNELSY